MKRFLLLLAFLLPVAAFAQTPLVLYVSYTAAVATKAIGQSTTIYDKVNDAVRNINTSYSSNSITAQFATPVAVTPALRAPADSESSNDQYRYALDSPLHWKARAGAGASISVHISDSTGDGTMSGTPTVGIEDSVIAMPYDKIDTQLEYAISRILGAGTGYAKRKIYLPADPEGIAGFAPYYCYHTREAAATDPNEYVTYPTYWAVNSVQSSQTRATLQADSCEAQRLIQISLGCGTNCTSKAIQTTGTTGVCSMMNNQTPPVATTNFPMARTTPAAQQITCPGGGGDVALGNYSTNGSMAVAPWALLGTAGNDSVAAMNAGRIRVFDYGVKGNLARFGSLSAWWHPIFPKWVR